MGLAFMSLYKQSSDRRAAGDQWIMATKTHSCGANPCIEEQLLLDLDMAVLGKLPRGRQDEMDYPITSF